MFSHRNSIVVFIYFSFSQLLLPSLLTFAVDFCFFVCLVCFCVVLFCFSLSDVAAVAVPW